MINFKNQDDVLASSLILLSILILTGTLIYALLVRFHVVQVPTVAGTVRAHEISLQKLSTDIARAKTLTAQAQVDNQTRLWQANPETVTAAVLAQLTNQTTKPNLKLAAFRPQRALPHGDVSEMMFTAQVTGPYPDVQHVVRSLDRAGGKIVLRSVQIAATEGATNAVTATLGLSTFVIPKPLAILAPTTTPRSVKRSGGARG